MVTPKPQLNTSRLGAGLLILSSFGYSFFSVFVRHLIEAGLQPIDIATWRFGLAVPILWLMISLRPRSTMRPAPRRGLLLGGLLMLAAALSAFYGLEYIPASLFTLLYYTFPAMVTAIMALRGERPGAVVLIALGLTLCGVMLSTPNLSEGLSAGGSLLGVALALFNAFVVALYFVVNSHMMHNYPDAPRATTWSLTGTVLPLLFLLPLRPPTIPPTLTAWAYLIGLVVVSTVIPIVALNAGIRLLGPVQASLLSALEPILTLVVVFVLLGDRLTLMQVVGGALILGSVIFVQWRQGVPDHTLSEKAITHVN